MAYDGKVLRQATLRFDEDKQRRQEQQRQRQQRVYQQCPELESIQREIRGTMGEIIASALRRGTDPLPAIRVIRDTDFKFTAITASHCGQTCLVGWIKSFFPVCLP